MEPMRMILLTSESENERSVCGSTETDEASNWKLFAAGMN